MKNVAAVVLALGMVACGSSGRSAVDSGGITIPDSGGGGRDAGMTTNPDTGMVAGTCNLSITATSFGALTGACVPRCSAATLSTLMSCADGTCVQNALDADTTPGIAWQQNGMAATQPLNCAACYSIQILHCLSVSGCATEVTDYISCDPTDPTTNMCMAENTALDTCQTTNMAAVQACATGAGGIGACFGS